MNYDYVVTLKNGRVRMINLVSLIICVLSLLMIAFTQIVQAGINWFAMAMALGMIAFACYAFLKNRKTGDGNASYSRALIFASLGWSSVPGFRFVCIPMIALAVLERSARTNLEIGFDKEEVVINSLIRKHYHWSHFTNICLKDALLTLDFKDNRLFQRETLDVGATVFETEFNTFCEQMLKSHSSTQL